MKKDYTHKIELQETIMKEKTERLQELQTDKELLQKDKTVLYQLFSNVKEMIASMTRYRSPNNRIWHKFYLGRTADR
jgi:hypothetical protein